jgi:predicted ribosomally synthesized peptide with SipW-like signal peptide
MLAFVGVVVVGATGAWFTNTETSTGNTFTAGIIDLKVDNESYVTNAEGDLVASSETSWDPSDLLGKYFFKFADLKPGDVGEDTISLHVENNPAWACLDITVTGTPENGQTTPESLVDTTVGANDGELQNELNFVFWKDDGDNVLEQDEVQSVFWQDSIQGISASSTLALADSQGGVLESGVPLIPGDTYYIGKAWCQGILTLDAVTQDGTANTNSPLQDTGIDCNGASIGNASQTDGVVADVTFSVEQSRHNDKFLCNPPQEGTLTLIKEVSGGSMLVDDFVLYVDGDTGSPLSSGDTVTVPAGFHNVTEGSYPDYALTYGADCPSGNVDVPANGNATCTLINTLKPGNVTINKVVVGGDYTNNPNFFNLKVGNEPVESGVSESFTAGTYSVTEDTVDGYTASYSNGCTGPSITVPANGSVSCTITNTYTTIGTLTVNKVVLGNPDANANDFNLLVTDTSSAVTPVVNGVSTLFSAGNYVVSEGDYPNYTTSFSGNCDANGNVTVPANGSASCTITNTMKTGTLTVNKVVTNNNGGDEDVSSFNLFIDGVAKTFGQTYTLSIGEHTVIETANPGVGVYDQTNTGACDANGSVTITADGNAVCTITNVDAQSNIRLYKTVVGGPYADQPQYFSMTIDGNPVSSGLSEPVNSNQAYIIDEAPVVDYGFTSITGDAGCPTNLGDSVTLDEGETLTCTITNTYTGS